jgi:hypothetical protein
MHVLSIKTLAGAIDGTGRNEISGYQYAMFVSDVTHAAIDTCTFLVL